MWVKVNGITMKPKVAAITNLDDCEQPSFGEIRSIFVHGSVVWLDLEKLETVVFDSHFHSWLVKRTDTSSLVKFSDLVCIQVLTIRPARNSTDLLLHITLKYSP